MRLEIRSFGDDCLDAAAAFLAARHRAHRAAAPGLDAEFEDPAHARAEIRRLAAVDGASGAVALHGGECVGYLLGVPGDVATWGPSAWVESAGHAVAEPELVRDLYRLAADRWLAEGWSRHYVVVPATDRGLVDAWFRLGFGQQHVHALRPSPPASFRVAPVVGLAIRPAIGSDLDVLTRLELVLPEHQAGSPVFSMLAIPGPDQVRAGLEHDLDDPRFTMLVAEHQGRVVGTATACSIELSSINTGLIRSASAGFLGFAAVLPEARGLGAGRALGESVLAWSRDAGYAWVATDWRATNLEASRAWPALGFRPTFLRLHRAIV